MQSTGREEEGEQLLRPSGSKKGTNSNGSSSSSLCQICHQDAARYTCPACNLRYCSVACFRSQGHGDCSESFYRDSLVQEVSGRQDVSTADQTKILDMLKRLQEQEQDDEEEEEDPPGGLSTALEDLDLDGMSADQLLALLSPDQRKQFEAILADPKKAEALLENHTEDIHKPWWTDDGDDDDDGDRGSAAESSLEAGGRPRPLPLEKLLKLPQGSSSSDDHFELGFNLSAILLAYALQHHVHPDATSGERAQSLATLVPFLATKSQLVLKSTQEAVEYVLANLDDGMIANRRRLMILLLQDLHQLLWLPRVLPSSRAEQVQLDKAYLALSDIYDCFASFSESCKKQKLAGALAVPKVLFYLSNLTRIPRQDLVRNAVKYRQELEKEEVDHGSLTDPKAASLILRPAQSQEPPSDGASGRATPVRVAKIEEIS